MSKQNTTKRKRPTTRKRCSMADVLRTARPTKATKRTSRKGEK